MREENIAAQFTEVMAAIKLDPRVVAWNQEELNACGAEEEAYHAEHLARQEGCSGMYAWTIRVITGDPA